MDTTTTPPVADAATDVPAVPAVVDEFGKTHEAPPEASTEGTNLDRIFKLDHIVDEVIEGQAKGDKDLLLAAQDHISAIRLTAMQDDLSEGEDGFPGTFGGEFRGATLNSREVSLVMLGCIEIIQYELESLESDESDEDVDLSVVALDDAAKTLARVMGERGGERTEVSLSDALEVLAQISVIASAVETLAENPRAVSFSLDGNILSSEAGAAVAGGMAALAGMLLGE